MAKVMISIPDDLLERIDTEAARLSMSRSEFLRHAIAPALGRPSPERMTEIIEEMRALFADAGPFDSAELIRRERDQGHSTG